MVLDNSNEEEPDVLSSQRRETLIQYLSELSDRGEQERLWVRHEDYPNVSGIDEIVHFLFDDTDLAHDSTEEVGISLLNYTEAIKLKMLCDALSSMLDRVGDAESEIYMKDSEWSGIMTLAASARDTLLLGK